MTLRDILAWLRDILNPWRALREARAELIATSADYEAAEALASGFKALFKNEHEKSTALRAELDRLKRAPKRDAKGRFVG